MKNFVLDSISVVDDPIERVKRIKLKFHSISKGESRGEEILDVPLFEPYDWAAVAAALRRAAQLLIESYRRFPTEASRKCEG